MEFNLPSQIVKDLSFGDEARNKILSGVYKLSNAVKSTLGASGKCVIYEDAMGQLKAKCLGKLLILAAIMTTVLEIKLEKLLKKLARMGSF